MEDVPKPLAHTGRAAGPASADEPVDGHGARGGGRGRSSLVRRHPLLSFFVLANALSWVAWLPYVLSQNGLGWWGFSFPPLLGTSQILGVLPGAFLGPIGSAFLVTWIADGGEGLAHWLRRMWRWRVAPRWYAITLLGVPTALLVTGAVYSGGQVSTPSTLTLAAYVPALVLQMLTTGLAEEPGWRDFALPRLQNKLGPLGGTMVLGPLWALWHAPLFLTEWGGWPEASWTRPVAFLIFCLGFNVVMTWVFNRTGESLPLAMMAHVSVNNFASVMWADIFPTLDGDTAMHAMAGGSVVAAVVIVVATRGRLGYHPVTVPGPAGESSRQTMPHTMSQPTH